MNLFAYTGGRSPTTAYPIADSRPTLVMIHGAANDHTVWALQSRYLAHHGFRVLAYDLPGHGRSNSPLLNSIEAMAFAILGDLDQRGIQSFIPIGHSMGSLISLELGRVAPDRVAAQCLLGTSAPMPVSEKLLDMIRNTPEHARQQINYWSTYQINVHPGTPGPGFSIYMQNLRLMQRQGDAALLNDFVACNEYQQGVVAAQQFMGPSLIIQGTNDLMTPLKAAQALSRTFKQCELKPIDDCGHGLMAEQPAQVLKYLFDFLRSVVHRPADKPLPAGKPPPEGKPL